MKFEGPWKSLKRPGISISNDSGNPVEHVCVCNIVWTCFWLALSLSTTNDISDGPNVESALSMSPTTAMITAESHKPTIGSRKQAPAKKGVTADEW